MLSHPGVYPEETVLEKGTGVRRDGYCIRVYGGERLDNAPRIAYRGLGSQAGDLHLMVRSVSNPGLIETYKLFILQLPEKQHVTWNLLCESNYVKFM